MSNTATLPRNLLPAEEDFSPPQEDVEEMALLKRIYHFTNPAEAERFLLEHDELIPYLLEADKHIKRVFGENIVDVCLEHASDPEEDYEGLFVIVKTNLSPEESLDLLDKLDDDWFLDYVPPEVMSILTVDVRPV